jgi:D-alanyl-D-alanine carboxypeptidase/D-alanyl-D-alanine-endopeptidase (penicillin-binding protein 4)
MKHRGLEIVMLQRFGSGIIASGLVALLLKLVGLQPATLDTVQLLAWQDMPMFALQTAPDPAAEGIMRQYLKAWGAKGAAQPNQGVWIQSGLSILADHQGNVPLPAASLTKIATTLAALEKWGPSHQFETLVSATGPIKDGVLQGDLVITGSGDPFFVWEEAIALGNSLNQLGIRRVTGNLLITGDFYMNFQDNPAISGQLLQQGLNGSMWSPEIVGQYSAMPKGTAKPQLAIAGSVQVATISIPKQLLLLRHRSLPLTQILKEMNIYSNNPMAEMLTKSVGGAQVRSQLAAQSANIPPTEIQLVNGSGLGVENQISPRAVCAMLITIEQFLQPHQLSVADMFPVSGRDKRGTMEARHMPVGTAIKTGTLNTVSALAGVLPTRDHGQVWFAIINRGDDVEGFRVQQDELLKSLSQKWGTLPSTNVSKPSALPLLGDPKRNETIFGV